MEVEVAAGSSERLRKVDVKYRPVVKNGDWVWSMRDCRYGQLHCLTFGDARRVQVECDGYQRSGLV